MMLIKQKITNFKNKYIMRHIAKKAFFRNVLTLMTGTIVAQTLLIIISPVLTRLYSPDDFGVFTIYMSLVSWVAVIVCGNYDSAIMMPTEDNDAINIIILSITIAFFISIVILFGILTFSSEIAKLLDNNEIEKWLYLVPFAGFFAGCYQTLNYWFNRKQSYKILACSRINQNVSLIIVNLIMGIKGLGASGLILGGLIGQISALCFLFWNFSKKNFNQKWLITFEKLQKQASVYRDFPRYQLLANFFNEASMHTPVFLLAIFFETSIVGFYSLAHRCISLPINILGRSIGQVFFQKASEYKHDNEKLKKLVYKIYKKLLVIGVLPFTILLIFGDLIFTFIFGAQWLVAGQYAQMISMWLLFIFITSPLSTLLIVKGLQKQNLIFNLLLFVFRASSLIIGGVYFQNSIIAIFLYGLISFILWLCYCMYLLNIAGIKYKNSLGLTFSTLSICFAVVFYLRLLFV